MFIGSVVLPDGEKIEIKGTMQECANWAFNVIMAYGGKLTIDINEVEQ